jgi:hypothetical protein
MGNEDDGPNHKISPRDIRIHPPNKTASENTSSTGPPEKGYEANTVEQMQHDALPFSLDHAQPLNSGSFPNPPRGIGNQIPATIPNVQYLLGSYRITVRYNTIRKKLSIFIPGLSGAADNADNTAMAQIISLASLNGLPIGQIPSFVDALGDRNQYNPVANWIRSRPWDSVDRLQSFYSTLVEQEDYPKPLKQKLMYCWMLSAVAAALMPSGFRARGVLTLQGPQSIGKTSWVRSLVPDVILREGVLKLDLHLDAGNKDSLLLAVSHWIVEIGELDSSFKKDIARLKGFLTSDQDKVRRPYARTESEYPRRTVFAATVNDHDFLPDATGNSRFWTVPVLKVNYDHGIDMQQLFAQLAVDFESGCQWWLTEAEERCLDVYNIGHRTVSAVRERILDAVDLARRHHDGLPAMTPTELLIHIGIQHPTNPQSKECAGVLREFLGESKRIHGQNKWRIPLKQISWSAHITTRKEENDDDQY